MANFYHHTNINHTKRCKKIYYESLPVNRVISFLSQVASCFSPKIMLMQTGEKPIEKYFHRIPTRFPSFINAPGHLLYLFSTWTMKELISSCVYQHLHSMNAKHYKASTNILFHKFPYTMPYGTCLVLEKEQEQWCS